MVRTFKFDATGYEKEFAMFILFVDEFLWLVKGRSGLNGFLKWLHLLILMDDTATSREGLTEKKASRPSAISQYLSSLKNLRLVSNMS